MDKKYKYPLYFVADDLEDQARHKIRRYFMKRRDSGGGDCGVIEKVGEKLYKISFEQQEDQERVLNRKTHTASLPSGQLHLNVTRTEAEAISLQTTSVQAPPKPSNASNYLERTFSWDIFLLCYLRDCSKAFKILEKQLTCIGCTVELNFDQEVVVVKADAKNGLGGAFSGVPEKWEIQVDRVLSSFRESFTCHHVVDPKKIQTILQDKTFTDDDVKMYNELGYLVAVGEKSLVEEKILNLNRNFPTKTELSIDEKQYNLIGEEFTREMRTNLPNVKIVKNNNVIVFDGLHTEVHLGLDVYDKLLKKIQLKHVPFSAELQNFFTTSDAIAKYKARFQQCLRIPVCLEMLNLDLILSSLSVEAAEEAAAILERDFCMAIVHLEGNAAKSPDLDRMNELLTKSKDHANIQERRIDVNLVPEPNSTIKVQLVGYSECVNQLKEELHDYLLNHVTVQDKLDLLNAEMVELFSKILTLFARKDSRVSLNASLVPYPCVLLSGPQQLVRKTKVELNRELESLISENLVIDGPGAVEYFNAEGKPSKELIERLNQVLIQEIQEIIYSVPCLPATSNVEEVSRRSSIVDRQTSINNINVEVKLGNLVNEQVDVLVAPMLKKSLQSTMIGKSLVRKGGLAMKMKFKSVRSKSLMPGGVLEMMAPASVGCSKLFFIECMPWDGLGGQSMTTLSVGLQRCLELCEEQRYSSMALPVIGPGKVLKYPLRDAILLLTEKLHQFGRTVTMSSSLKSIHIVIKPDGEQTEEIYHEVYRQLIQNMNQGQVSFRSISSELVDLSITVGGVQLQLVFGDITNERTQAVVNSTNFENLNTGVCKDILAVAGPEVEAELKSATVERGEVFVTQPGRFPCQGLMHVSAKGDRQLIRQLMGSIVQYCEVYGWSSVAIPAIGAGASGLSAGDVAVAMLQGLSDSLSYPLSSLVKVRLVFNKINIFSTFREEASQMFSAVRKVVTPPSSYPPGEPAPPPPPASITTPRSRTSSSDQKSVFRIIGLSQNNISKAMTTMKEVYQAQSSSQTFKKQELEALMPADFATLKEVVESLGLKVQTSEGDWIVTGLTVKVNQVINLVQSFMYGTLTREKRTREEEELYRKVAWCIQGSNGEWERLPKAANYELENQNTEGGVKDAHGLEWDVDLTNMELTKKFSNEKAALKRLENLPDFTFPLYWDDMASDEKLKVVPLLESCAEYQKVKQQFKQSCPKTVIKIERVQNIHLRRCYEVQLKHISDKNKRIGGAKERLLYHGTTNECTKAIMNKGFDWRFAGQNATYFGQGNYFALHASYSAHPTYSKPTMDGTQRMFLVRVLTGLHTLGQKDMKLPPPRDLRASHDRFDSVVDNMLQPNMFVVFQDHQAYPDYLITFK
ncbi:protein mono-ADP-ribosyltransferase PARP14-like [Periophthalmus magnuspinnatus]|uniref:protein mono-ADP-ribosyltransferase PARP14-like n=1 Tax=Periophthalmus magnuspinnatus TaxID=409849 RepID=UPI0024370599|nr:protein mono-ADP-ribosyltransferase PARP14-like [Periophthalmus magnuspinnatus]